MSYLGSDLRYKKTITDVIRDAINFTFSIVPKDIPLNSDYGVVVPSTVNVANFCEEYKANITNALNKLGYGITVEDVSIDGKILKVKLSYNKGEVDTWELSL